MMNHRKNAKNAGNAPSKNLTHTHVYNKVDNEEPDESEELQDGSDPNQPLPSFTEADWPKILLLIMSYATSPTQRDVMLLGALTAIGASMERYVRCPYAGKLQSPCLQSFIVAPSASGKGILSFIRLLVEPIHDEIRQKVVEEVKAYKKEKAAYDTMGKERCKVEAPQMPKNKMFLISGNNTGTGILQNIMDANGTGLICETEADTISAAIGSEYGHWSDTLRKAFDHDRLSYNRRTDQEYREVNKNPNEFTFPNYGSFVYWVTKGYAVLDDASFPIIGEGKTEPNDTFISQLVDNAEAAINAIDQLGYINRNKVGIGGHSYGAFMTANLLTHSKLFACGIARSGAYNRTLTPFGFQSEQRNYWDIPAIYNEMSPFMNADKMKTPLLLVHGDADNNPGTFTLQSERYFQALKGLGAPVRLVLLPKESHGYAAKDNILHLLWEQEQFLDKYLKN
jgi:dienelactone hydrolase